MKVCYLMISVEQEFGSELGGMWGSGTLMRLLAFRMCRAEDSSEGRTGSENARPSPLTHGADKVILVVSRRLQCLPMWTLPQPVECPHDIAPGFSWTQGGRSTAFCDPALKVMYSYFGYIPHKKGSY